ncbi:MAG: hypothetical protein R3194_01580 [Limnobacter sp.]|nr:hypothetical protein [Limnobacter sp.]
MQCAFQQRPKLIQWHGYNDERWTKYIEMLETSDLPQPRLALQWARRAARQLPFILSEVQARMIARAEIIRPCEGGVVVHGWLHHDAVAPVQSLFPERKLITVAPLLRHDEAHIKSGVSGFGTLMRKVLGTSREPELEQLVCPPGQALPVSEASTALLWSPLWLQCFDDPVDLFEDWFRVLKLQGCVFFSTLGPDTANVLRRVAGPMNLPFPEYTDMHDLGDLMTQAGFSDPVMEMEKITLTYADANRLLDEWRDLFGGHRQPGSSGLKGRQFKQALVAELEKQRSPADGRIHLVLEVVYGHAWKVKPKMAPGEALISVDNLRSKKPKVS